MWFFFSSFCFFIRIHLRSAAQQQQRRQQQQFHSAEAAVGISSKLSVRERVCVCVCAGHTKTIGMWNVVFIDKISFQNDLTCMKNSQTKSKTGFVVKSELERDGAI